MKTILLLLLLSVLAAPACDTKLVVDLTISPGGTHAEIYDYSDCQFGIRNNSYFVNYKGKGATISLFDVTTGVSYGNGVKVQGGTVFYLVNNGDSMAGHVLQLTIANGTRKSLSVEIQQGVCYCGPP